ncbi:MAG: hypothetical protein EBW14_15965 [Oxalobacteraceae bacterium]|nr:hypothetical protein [Oxalobacteraceae bacterium]
MVALTITFDSSKIGTGNIRMNNCDINSIFTNSKLWDDAIPNCLKSSDYKIFKIAIRQGT